MNKKVTEIQKAVVSKATKDARKEIGVLNKELTETILKENLNPDAYYAQQNVKMAQESYRQEVATLVGKLVKDAVTQFGSKLEEGHLLVEETK